MLPAIQFHDQFFARGTEIDNIVTDGVLRFKIDTLQQKWGEEKFHIGHELGFS